MRFFAGAGIIGVAAALSLSPQDFGAGRGKTPVPRFEVAVPEVSRTPVPDVLDEDFVERLMEQYPTKVLKDDPSQYRTPQVRQDPRVEFRTPQVMEKPNGPAPDRLRLKLPAPPEQKK